MRAAWAKIKVNYKFRMKVTIFEALQCKKMINNDMANVVGHLEYFMRTKMLDDSFKAVKSFSTSKKKATRQFKLRATQDVLSILTQRHCKVLRKYYNKYRFKVFEYIQRIKRLRGIYGKINSQLMHINFRKWVFYANKHLDSQEQNEVGPVTEQVFEANRLMKNLKDFMKEEGYTDEQIKRIPEEIAEKELQRM